MLFFTDWEGPWVLTDFAYEVAIAFFNNHEFFERLSQYDDYLVLIEQKENYEAGDTLKLLAPFLVALDVTSEELRDLAEKVLAYTPDAEESMRYLIERGFEPVVISTSYIQFLEVSAKPLGINKIHSTHFKPEAGSIVLEEPDLPISIPGTTTPTSTQHALRKPRVRQDNPE
jgi:predicted HAD superfamily phosphohydrolase